MVSQQGLITALVASYCLGPTVALSPPSSRRNLLKQTVLATCGTILGPNVVLANDDFPNMVRVRLESPYDSLGVQIVNTEVRGQKVVAITKVIQPKSPKLQEGMILRDFPNAQALVERIRSGPFPVDLEFINLAAGGDAISDLGTPMVTPKDALELAQKTDAVSPQQGNERAYSISSLTLPQPKCAIQSRRLDVLEIQYKAFYETSDGRKLLYDASSMRGTGRPYQMVLGSGDMIPGVDQGLYNMCPGDVRNIMIPPILGYGKRARDSFRIPVDYVGLEWNVELVTIDGTIRPDNNEMSREEREGRVPY